MAILIQKPGRRAQAMAAYRTAARLFPGLHLPLVGMGMEYQRMNNLHLAEQMFVQARSSSRHCHIEHDIPLRGVDAMLTSLLEA